MRFVVTSGQLISMSEKGVTDKGLRFKF